MEWINDSMTGG